MLHRIWRYRILIYLALLACVGPVACQAPQPQCCDIAYGLLRQTDLTGRWDLATEFTQELMDSVMTISRYDEIPTAEYARQYLLGTYGSQTNTVAIIHDLRHYEPAAPPLDNLSLHAFKEVEGGSPFEPNIIKIGDVSQAQCQASNPADIKKSITVCLAESHYKQFISIMLFAFSRPASNEDIQNVMNQALSETDKRIQQIDQHE